ncbi:MAG: hypothetical protein ACJAXA_003263 [Candidatus Aldehydirespiratoraceae bacterium]
MRAIRLPRPQWRQLRPLLQTNPTEPPATETPVAEAPPETAASAAVVVGGRQLAEGADVVADFENNSFTNLEQFARDHLDDVDVIGFGTQDSRDEALDFVEQYGTSSFTMLWDESFQSWSAFEVTGQPTVILLGTTGEELGRWSGAIPEAEGLELAAAANN